ncbi:hypothetical protein NKH77_05605 [Streptomyces sp. M19]
MGALAEHVETPARPDLDVYAYASVVHDPAVHGDCPAEGDCCTATARVTPPSGRPRRARPRGPRGTPAATRPERAPCHNPTGDVPHPPDLHLLQVLRL